MRRSPLSILHLTATAAGGAGRAATRIAESLRRLGHDSSLLIADCGPAPGAIALATRVQGGAEEATSRFLGEFLEQKYLDRLRDRRRSNTRFSAGLHGAALAELPLVRGADILHAHFIPGITTPNALRELLALGKPVVWTQHDQWAFTGGCHYSDGCLGYETLCTACPQLRRDPWGLPALLQAEKAACFADGLLHLVTPSAWMGEALRTSSVLRGAGLSVIRNPIDLDRFRPLAPGPRKDLRARMGIGAADVVLIAGAISQAEMRKGFDLLIDGLRGFAADLATPAPNRLWVLSFGHDAQAIDIPGIETLALGPLEDDTALATILGLGDLLVIPSREDNYPNLMVEALACGTPVAAFARGGLAELVIDGVSGLLLGEVPDAQAITTMLDRVVAAPDRLAGMRAAARAAVAPSHGLVAIGLAHEALYKSLLPLSRLRRATAPAEGEALIPLASVFRTIPARLAIQLGPVLAEGPAAKPVQAALDAFRAADAGMPGADSFIADHTAIAQPPTVLAGIIAAAQARRGCFDREAALDAAELRLAAVETAPPPSASAAPTRPLRPPTEAVFFGTVLLTTADAHPPGVRLRVMLRSDDGDLPAEGWCATSGGETLPCRAHREGGALVMEFTRAAATPAGTHVDLVPPAVQGFVRRDQMRVAASPVAEAPAPNGPLPMMLTALMAEGWDGFYNPEFANGRWVRWMSPVGHLALPRWQGEAGLVIEGFKRPALFAERRVMLHCAGQSVSYEFEQQPGTPEDQAESLWRVRARLPPPAPDRPPVLTLRAALDLPPTPGDPRTITVLLAAAWIEAAETAFAWTP
ncbi:MAG: glycosyltransferase [Pseudomonadota bacterium]